MSENLWWGYKHVSGSYQAKRYWESLDIREALESEFCARVVGPFPATNREDALNIVREMTNSRPEKPSNDNRI